MLQFGGILSRQQFQNFFPHHHALFPYIKPIMPA
jgi:hypothetical protein